MTGRDGGSALQIELPPGLGMPAGLDMSAVPAAEGAEEDDANNLDTFGDCEVGDDWQPTVAQDFFAREHQERRTGNAHKAAEGSDASKPPPPHAQSGQSKPPGLEGAPPLSAPRGSATAAPAGPLEAPPLPSGLLGAGGPGIRGPVPPWAASLALGAAAGRPPPLPPGAAPGAGLFGMPPLHPELAAAAAAAAAVAAAGKGASVSPLGVPPAFPPPGWMAPGMPQFAPPFMGPRGSPLPFSALGHGAALGVGAGVLPEPGHAPGRPLPPPGLAPDLRAPTDPQAAGAGRPMPPGLGAESLLSGLMGPGFPLGGPTAPASATAAPAPPLGPPGMMHPPGLQATHPAMQPNMMAALGLPPHAPPKLHGVPPTGPPAAPPGTPMQTPSASRPPKVFSVAELERGMMQDAGKAAGAPPHPLNLLPQALSDPHGLAVAAAAAAAVAGRHTPQPPPPTAGLASPSASSAALAARLASANMSALAARAAVCSLMGPPMPGSPTGQVTQMPRSPPPPPASRPTVPGLDAGMPLGSDTATVAAPAPAVWAEVPQPIDEEEEEVPTPVSFIAPFTQAHRAQLKPSASAAAGGHGAVRRFLRKTAKLKQHASIMSTADKELIVRIQLSQMAAMGGAMGAPLGAPLDSQAPGNRGNLMRGAQRLDDKEPQMKDAASPSHASSPGTAAAVTLVTQLQASISEAPSDALPASDSPAPDAPQVDKAAVSAEAGSPRAASEAAAGELSAPADDALRSGLRADEKFGKSRYASVHHPRRTLAIPSRDAEEAPAEQATEGAYWFMQFALEQTYGTLFDLEQISYRLSESDSVQDETENKLLLERSEKLELVAHQLFDLPSSESPDSDASGKEQVSKSGPPLVYFLGFRKGRMLLHRLLVCLAADKPRTDDAATAAATAAAPASTDGSAAAASAATPALSLLWRLVVAVLSMPGVLLELAKSPSGSATRPTCGTAPKDVSWRKLRGSLVRSLQSILKSRLPSADCAAVLGTGRSAACAEALTVLMDSHNREELAVLCMLKHGLALVRLLIDGCREAPHSTSAQSEATAWAEAVRGRLIETFCKDLPVLYQVATNRELPARGAGGLSTDDAELLSQEELWGLLIALTEQASAAQKRRARELIGKFVSEVDGANSTHSKPTQPPGLSPVPEG